MIYGAVFFSSEYGFIRSNSTFHNQLSLWFLAGEKRQMLLFLWILFTTHNSDYSNTQMKNILVPPHVDPQHVWEDCLNNTNTCTSGQHIAIQGYSN